MKDFFKSLLSRKFLLALGTGIILVANQQYTELVYLVLGYMGVNVAQKTVVK